MIFHFCFVLVWIIFVCIHDILVITIFWKWWNFIESKNLINHFLVYSTYGIFAWIFILNSSKSLGNISFIVHFHSYYKYISSVNGVYKCSDFIFHLIWNLRMRNAAVLRVIFNFHEKKIKNWFRTAPNRQNQLEHLFFNRYSQFFKICGQFLWIFRATFTLFRMKINLLPI